ncbi:Uncharacterized protein conserved in bacteria,XapX domain,Protein of unknown function (DUF1427) [Burkholderia stabilis]|uniref:XapX domain-containing protein n=2 Tax=Burkholderia stabilis TaxID=95485 RepID=A0AAJ5N3W4_9BURK|nr:Uncharacterized protein conserved in bacteria,XapX domain,Protein of unknown function (DUF1427) [Burkholderia stabilis]
MRCAGSSSGSKYLIRKRAARTPKKRNRSDSGIDARSGLPALFLFTQTRYAFGTLTACLRLPIRHNGTLTMKPYFLSLLAGILAGVIYGAIGVNSPAPPIIALLGLLGMLAGEQILPLARRMLAGHRLNTAWRDAQCSQHMFGALPGGAPNDRKPS